MTGSALKVIKDAMADLGIAYSFMRYSGKEYPYFVGEYTESPQPNEDGLQDTTFLLTGFTRSTWEELESAKARIKKKFHQSDGLIVTTNEGVVAIFYENSLVVPTGDAELKRIQINLIIKEWSVN